MLLYIICNQAPVTGFIELIGVAEPEQVVVGVIFGVLHGVIHTPCIQEK